jgi:hypothetical protein
MRTITYNGVEIRIWEQSIAAGYGETFWLKRPVEEADVWAIQTAIDAGRRSLAREIKAAQDTVTHLIEGK